MVQSIYSTGVSHICFNTLEKRPNGSPIADAILWYIFCNENDLISIKVWLQVVPWGQTDHKAALFQVMVLHRIGKKPLLEPMMAKVFVAIWRR